MPVTTIHQYLDEYPFRPSDTRMILGTMHPHVTEDFLIPFYYGNVGSFWDILGNAFPEHNFETLESITNVLANYNIWVTDIIQQCDRNNAGVTKDCDLYNLVLNTRRVRTALENSNIDTIFFTSRFSSNNAAKLFTDAFNINYRISFSLETSEFLIPEHYFGRVIRGVVLYSPSNDANRGIAKGAPPYINNIEYFRQFQTPVKQFKIEFYQQKFDFLNN